MDCEDCGGTGKCPDCVPLGDPSEWECGNCYDTKECPACGGTGEE